MIDGRRPRRRRRRFLTPLLQQRKRAVDDFFTGSGSRRLVHRRKKKTAPFPGPLKVYCINCFLDRFSELLRVAQVVEATDVEAAV
ncbi:hypothetical protein, partial [Dokdonella sp.]|uniref:hypothetical protein n=1 Tax=Dokdonella sp. TaxID=2291710 RepID=UPI0026290F99